MIQHFAELTRNLLECKYLSVVLIEPERDRLHLAAVAGASKEQEHAWSTTVEKLFLHEALDAGSLSRLGTFLSRSKSRCASELSWRYRAGIVYLPYDYRTPPGAGGC